jgi:hypothetical protein
MSWPAALKGRDFPVARRAAAIQARARTREPGRPGPDRGPHRGGPVARAARRQRSVGPPWPAEARDPVAAGHGCPSLRRLPRGADGGQGGGTLTVMTPDQLTGQVLAACAGTPDPRRRQLLASLIGHLHAFAVETRLTRQEWPFRPGGPRTRPTSATSPRWTSSWPRRTTPSGFPPAHRTYPGFGQLTPKTGMIMTPSQILDAPPPYITDFGHWNRDEMDVIMTEIRLGVVTTPAV